MYFVDTLHQHGIGVILDWVPSHFPTDEHGLAYFDGTHLYEHADPSAGIPPGMGQLHLQLRPQRGARLPRVQRPVLARPVPRRRAARGRVASMLYLDYSRKAGEWVPNRYGGRENLEAIEFLRPLNEAVYREHPDVQTIAEESTAWPMVSRPVYIGGLGFGMKWDMGWMHDTLKYFGPGSGAPQIPP